MEFIGYYFQMQAFQKSIPPEIANLYPFAMQWDAVVRQKLKELKWSIADLGRKMGRGDDAAFMENLYKAVRGKVKNPRGTMVADIAKALGMTEKQLRFEEGSPTKDSSLAMEPMSTRRHESFAPNVRFGAPPIEPFARVPLRGQGMGGKDGAIVFNGGDNMGDILAPPILFNVPGAYAVYVVGDSMAPRLKDGEVVYVHPHRRVVKGDDCVIQIEKDIAGERVGWIKEFVSRDDKTLKVLQHNPRKILTFPVKKVVSVHLIVMSGKV